MTLALELDDLRKSFGSAEIIRGLNLKVEKGERHAIIGPNGAGKSTMFNLITGRFPQTSGHVRLHGTDLTGLQPFQINRLGLSRSFQITNIFPKMTVFENVRCSLLWSMGFKYSFWNMVSRNRALNEGAEEILEQINLTVRRDLPAGVLSYAEQRALEIGITIAGGADVIMLDEPTAGVSPIVMDELFDRIIEVARTGISILMVEQNARQALNIADKGYVLVQGRNRFTDTGDRLLNDPEVRKSFLGG